MQMNISKQSEIKKHKQWLIESVIQFGGKFKSAYKKHKNQLEIGQNELKTIQSAKEMLRNDAKTMYLVYERLKLS